jgi:ribosomal-protein-alanine N-acetyltransferase
MSQQVLPFRIEPMTLADIPEVIAIERLSYSMTWPQKTYDYELQRNELAHYFILRLLNRPARELTNQQIGQPADPQDESCASATGAQPSLNSEPSGRGLSRVVSGPAETIIGLGGFWLIADQIHISTIAIHPNWRRLGLGEWMLITLLEEGLALGANIATLEVRPSNHTAILLYGKYDFREVGRRPRYYSDNSEDALIFTTPPLALPDYQAMFHQRKATLTQRLAQIDIDKVKQIG